MVYIVCTSYQLTKSFLIGLYRKWFTFHLKFTFTGVTLEFKTEIHWIDWKLVNKKWKAWWHYISTCNSYKVTEIQHFLVIFWDIAWTLRVSDNGRTRWWLHQRSYIETYRDSKAFISTRSSLWFYIKISSSCKTSFLLQFSVHCRPSYIHTVWTWINIVCEWHFQTPFQVLR